MKKSCLLFASLIAIGALVLQGRSAAGDQTTDHKVHVMLTPETIEWKEAPPTLPPGAKVAMLEGDPKKAGFFAMRIKVPAGYRIPPHFHPVQERVTVIEGTFALGQGETFDEKALEKYPAGSYVSMPAGMRHFAFFKRAAVIQLASVGPWGITYVNPADDPRNKKAEK